LGRFNTILIFSLIYLVGLVCFVFGTIPTNVQPLLIFGGMYIVSIGAGGIKPNCSTMGADQFDLSYPRDVVESKQFFSFFYWAINLGALFAYTGIAYICQYGAGESLGGQEWGFFVGYILPTLLLGIGIIIFISASKKYKKNPPQGSMLSLFSGLIWEAITSPELQHNATGRTASSTTSSILKQTIDYHHGEGQLALDGVATWLDRAKRENGGNYYDNEVESAKYIVRLIPFLFVMIPYWGIYGQTKTAFQIMGCQMNSNIDNISLPISSMNIFNNLAILILVPLFEAKLYPYLKNKGIQLTMLKKIGFGFGFGKNIYIIF
jgi:peptide/histidine transporter 3/4